MKVNTENFPIKEFKGDNKAPKRNAQPEKTDKGADRVTLSVDNKRLVLEENKSAAATELLDFKKAEEEIYNLKSKLLDGKFSASEIHQLGGKRVLFLALD